MGTVFNIVALASHGNHVTIPPINANYGRGLNGGFKDLLERRYRGILHHRSTPPCRPLFASGYVAVTELNKHQHEALASFVSSMLVSISTTKKRLINHSVNIESKAILLRLARELFFGIKEKVVSYNSPNSHHSSQELTPCKSSRKDGPRQTPTGMKLAFMEQRVCPGMLIESTGTMTTL